MSDRFKSYMKEVDRCLNNVIGVGSDDMPDFIYRDMFDDEVSAVQCAEYALEYWHFDC